jgi:predicted lipoprotein with Yx(FWY)xxD motif
MALLALRTRSAAVGLVAGFALAAVLATAASGALVSVYSSQNSALGKILVSATGRTLYHYSPDTKLIVKCTGSCSAQWPPLLVAAGAKPVAGPGVSSDLLGTVKRPDGKYQVTYHGLSLYTYAGDKKSGDVKGQGSGGLWHAIAPTGATVTKSVTVSSGSGSKSSGSTSGSGSSGGSSGGSNTGGGGDTSTDCATNPGGYGCM